MNQDVHGVDSEGLILGNKVLLDWGAGPVPKSKENNAATARTQMREREKERSVFPHKPRAEGSLGTAESVKALEGVADEGNDQFGTLFVRLGFRPQSSSIVRLVDLLRREVSKVDIGLQLGPERRLDLAEVLENDAPEKGMGLDLRSTSMSQPLRGIANETRLRATYHQHTIVSCRKGAGFKQNLHKSGCYLRMRCSASGPSWISSGK